MNAKSLIWLLLMALVASRAPAQPAATTSAAAPGDAAPADASPDDVVISERLLDRAPFDRVTLNAANQNTVIETVLLDLPSRTAPDPATQTGSLELHRLSQPSIPYAVAWADIAKVELYEHLLLDEARRLTAAGDFSEAFDYLAFLQANYPALLGLPAALDEHLWRDASASFGSGDGDAAWPALLALYDRNPAYPRLVNAVQAVSDGLMAAQLERQNYAAARAVLDLIERQFPKLELANIARWKTRFAADAETKLSAARAALAAGNFDAARTAAIAAEAIAPDLAEPRKLLEQIQAAAPEFRVGVMQLAQPTRPGAAPDWAAARVNELVNPSLVRMVDFGAEGGVYDCRFGEITTSDSGLETRVRFFPGADGAGIAADGVALRLLEDANLNNPAAREDFAAALASIKSSDGRELLITWRQPHLHPEAFLQTPLRGVTSAAKSPGLWFDIQNRPPNESEETTAVHFERTKSTPAKVGLPHIVVERLFDDDEAALAALARGEIDALDRVPPWQLAQARKMAGVEVEPYALPTVHVLVPNFKNPLLATREFRRALCYAIDCPGVVHDILLGGEDAPGFTPLSGPFPVGVTLNDPIGYGYNADLAQRPYEPRLAALLAGVARTTLAKRDVEERKARGETIDPVDPTVEPSMPPLEPLILLHPADAIARVACQSLKLQLDQVGIPITLVEAPAGTAVEALQELPYDLLYAELAVFEPLTDARRLLGPHGVAGRSSALMIAALDQLDRSQNWNEARGRLRAIHRIAFFDLPLIPLWQTVNHFAHRTWLTGIGERPLTLYQNLDDWRKNFGTAVAGGRP